MILALALAWATDPGLAAAERLADIPVEPPSSLAGTVQLQAHGPTPGHVRPLPLTTQLHVTDDARTVAIDVDPVQTTRIPHRGQPLVHDGRAWSDALDWDVAMALAPWPGHLAAWLRDRPADLLLVDDHTLGWATDQGMATIELVDGAMQRIVLRRDHPVFGDVDDTLTWTDGRLRMERAEDDVRWSLELSPSDVQVAPEPPPDRRLKTRDLQSGLWAIEVPEANSRVFALREKRDGVVLDAPLSDAIGRDLLTILHDIDPDVAWSVVVSHHHPHYVGGLGPFVEAGLPIYVHPELLPWLREELTRPRTRNGRVLPEPQLRPLPHEGTLLNGAVRVHHIDEDSEHTEAFLVTELKDHRALYVADLGGCPENRKAWQRGSWPAIAEQHGLNRILSGFPLEGAATECPLTGFDP